MKSTTRLEVPLQPDENKLLERLCQHLAHTLGLRVTKAGALRYAMRRLAQQEGIAHD